MDRFCAGSAFFCGSGSTFFKQNIVILINFYKSWIRIRIHIFGSSWIRIQIRKKKYGSATLLKTHAVPPLKGRVFYQYFTKSYQSPRDNLIYSMVLSLYYCSQNKGIRPAKVLIVAGFSVSK